MHKRLVRVVISGLSANCKDAWRATQVVPIGGGLCNAVLGCNLPTS